MSLLPSRPDQPRLSADLDADAGSNQLSARQSEPVTMSRRSSDRASQPEGAKESIRETAAPAAPKPYLRPVLQSYGKLVDVTRFGGSVVSDSGVGSLGQS